MLRWCRFLVGLTVLFITPLGIASKQIVDNSGKSLEWFREHCVPLKDAYHEVPSVERECKVAEFGNLHLADGPTIHYALYRRLARKDGQNTYVDSAYDSFPSHNTAVVVFEDTGNRLITPIWADLNSHGSFGTWYESPKILPTTLGTILEIPIRSGPKVENSDKHLLWHDGKWRPLETNSWRSQVNSRLPEGHWAWTTRIDVDLVKMQIEASVWKPGDATCCPTGGEVTISFVFRGQKLAIQDFQHTQAK